MTPCYVDEWLDRLFCN